MDTLIKRLGHYVDVASEAFQDIERLPHRTETRQAGQEIIVEGETVDDVFVVEVGWAIRFRMLDDGRRQILNFMLPGDCFDLMSVSGAKSDHNVSAATDVVMRRVNAKVFLKAMGQKPELATSFWWAAIQEEAILREQIIRNGRRTAIERVAHMILELNRRVAAVTGELDDHLDFPIPQSMLADALGISNVHVSRTITRLREENYIRATNRGFEIVNREAMAEMCDFDSRYLHLDKLRLNPNGKTGPD
ncbi:Crp/Fnr family transcriptional regulator [Litorimonas sp. RW-G-Af-16]|uniref:Crp/Fnr family transcriptional regulator n=1 Tax=Litorimonas sp. RW-G-Af-16 TaxID=3241168 RepID=UPI00390C6B29